MTTNTGRSRDLAVSSSGPDRTGMCRSASSRRECRKPESETAPRHRQPVVEYHAAEYRGKTARMLQTGACRTGSSSWTENEEQGTGRERAEHAPRFVGTRC